WTDPWVGLVRRSGALRSWLYGHGLRERGLPTARPLAVLHRRRRGLCYEGYLLTEKIEGAADLHAFVAGLASLPAPEGRAALRQRIAQVARLVRELHRRHLSHRDLKASNILLSGGEAGHGKPGRADPLHPPVWLIDLVGLGRYGKLPRTRQVQNLA